MTKKIKCLVVKNSDFDSYNDWLNEDAAKAFIDGKFTHIVCANEVIEVEIIKFKDNAYGVCTGEGLSVDFRADSDTFINNVQQVVEAWKCYDAGDGYRPDLLKILGDLIMPLEKEVFI